MKITPVPLNFLDKTITDLRVTTSFCSEDTTCRLNYALYTSENEIIKFGYIDLTAEQYADWGYDNAYIEDIVLSQLELTRL